MPGDLHTHTTFSDGSTKVEKLPFLAACAGMTHLALSDHDSSRACGTPTRIRCRMASILSRPPSLRPMTMSAPTACICSATGRMTAPRWRTFPP